MVDLQLPTRLKPLVSNYILDELLTELLLCPAIFLYVSPILHVFYHYAMSSQLLSHYSNVESLMRYGER
jgi:hypothetical protein